jgi:hypothetical protein
MNGSRDLACEHIRTALGLERAGLAVALSGAIADRAVLCDALARHGESAARFSQLLTPGTDIEVAFSIECEVAAGESSVRALGLVDQVHVRFDPALIHQPPDHIGRAVAPIRDQARRGNVEPSSRANGKGRRSSPSHPGRSDDGIGPHRDQRRGSRRLPGRSRSPAWATRTRPTRRASA